MSDLTTTLGVIMDTACFITVFVYFPLANWWESKQRKAMESEIPDDEWYECEM